MSGILNHLNIVALFVFSTATTQVGELIDFCLEVG